jgi:hypothetical protein
MFINMLFLFVIFKINKLGTILNNNNDIDLDDIRNLRHRYTFYKNRLHKILENKNISTYYKIGLLTKENEYDY